MRICNEMCCNFLYPSCLMKVAMSESIQANETLAAMKLTTPRAFLVARLFCTKKWPWYVCKIPGRAPKHKPIQ
jgi:hypothetical protein